MRGGFGTIGPRPPGRRGLLPGELADPWFAESLFDRTPDVVFWVKNVRGEYAVVNETMLLRSGRRSKEEILGRTAVEVFPDPLGRIFAEQDQRVASTGRAIRDRLELHFYPDRTRGWCLTSKFPLFDPEGRVLGTTGLSRDVHLPSDARAGTQALARSLQHLQAHYDRPLRLAQLARIAEMPARRFERLVKRVFHLTPVQLLIRARLDAAAELLLETDRTIARIAGECGYADQSAFTRQFKATTGLSPRQFRQASAGLPRTTAEPGRSHGRD